MEYNRNSNLDNIHSEFNKECNSTDVISFKSNKLMKSIVQNCSYSSGISHKIFIETNYKNVLETIDFDLLKRYDSIGGSGDEKLINGLSPKVYSYIKEALIYYSAYLKPKKINEINNLLIIGGGYGMEAVILYNVLKSLNIKINNITGIDMPSVAELQNFFFKTCNLEHICKSYDENYIDMNIDLVYSNCCLAELNEKTNYKYYNEYISKSRGFYIVWGLWCADIPEYYKKYENTIIDKILNEGLYNRHTKRVNCLFLK